MRILIVFILALSIAVLTGEVSTAHPPNAIIHGNSCATCHERSPEEGGLQGGGEARPDAMSVLGDTTLDPDESLGTPPDDWVDRGALKLFTARPGDTVDLTMQVEQGATEYAVQLKRFEKEGFSGIGNRLAGYFEFDLDWVAHGFDDSTYYTHSPDDFDGHDWITNSVTPVPFTFSLTLSADAPLDLYDLEFATAGIDATLPNGKWYGDEHFYLNVVPEPSPNMIVCLGWVALFVHFVVRKPAPRLTKLIDEV